MYILCMYFCLWFVCPVFCVRAIVCVCVFIEGPDRRMDECLCVVRQAPRRRCSVSTDPTHSLDTSTY